MLWSKVRMALLHFYPNNKNYGASLAKSTGLLFHLSLAIDASLFMLQ